MRTVIVIVAAALAMTGCTTTTPEEVPAPRLVSVRVDASVTHDSQWTNLSLQPEHIAKTGRARILIYAMFDPHPGGETVTRGILPPVERNVNESVHISFGPQAKSIMVEAGIHTPEGPQRFEGWWTYVYDFDTREWWSGTSGNATWGPPVDANGIARLTLTFKATDLEESA